MGWHSYCIMEGGKGRLSPCFPLFKPSCKIIMRLEFKPTVISAPAVENGTSTDTSIPDSINFEYQLNQGIKAAQKGEREQARLSLSNAAQLNPESEEAWMWLASISDYPEELLAFLGKALEINPDNQKAVSWQAATRSLLAKTLVQRGIAAGQEGSNDLAQKCLDEALVMDKDCELAWFWKASFSNDEEERLEFLEQVLNINPNNEEASAAIDGIRSSRFDDQIRGVKQSIASGNQSDAMEVLDRLLHERPSAIEALLLKFHFSPSLNEKIDCANKVLAITPDVPSVREGYEFLTSVAQCLDERGGAGRTKPLATFHFEPTAEDTLLTSEAAPSHVVEEASPAVDYSHEDTIEEEYPIGVSEMEETVSADVEVAPTIFENGFHNHEGAATQMVVSEAASENDVQNAEVDTLDEEFITSASSSSEIVGDGNQPIAPEPHLRRDELVASIPTPAVLVSDFTSKSTGTPCPFCTAGNDAQAFQCGSCHAMLTLSDMDSLLANSKADSEIIRQAVSQMESEYHSRSLNESELTMLGIGHLNLRNYQTGRQYLQEAARLDPNNVILTGQVNAIAIRIEEMDRNSDSALSMPQGRTILVVDDSATVRKLISAKLEKSGHKVICAEDGVEALARIAETVPDLVLLDITMPRMDGYEVCKNIRSNPASQGIPVVMISGKDGFFDIARGRRAGTTGYVTKPFGPETLMKALETYLIPDSSEFSSS